LQGLANVADQHFTRRSENQLARQPLENWRPELGLERKNLATDGGGRDVKMARSLTDRSGARHLVHIGQQAAMQHPFAPARKKASLWSMLLRCLKGNGVCEIKRFYASLRAC